MSAGSSFHDLDWPKFLELASKEARTPYGRQRILALREVGAFAGTPERAQELQQETSEISALLERSALWGPLIGLEEVDAELESLEKGGVLELSALNRLRSWFHVFDSWIHFPLEQSGRLFKEALSGLLDPHEGLRVLGRILTPSGELSEKASPALATLNSQIREVRREIGIRMEALLRDYAGRGLLQERYSDVRDGRFVLPVKVSEQGKVEGRVTELSVSRQTVFIEPKEVEQLQSRLRRLEADLAQEVFAILLQASRELRPFAGSIAASVIRVGYWDAVQARARIAKVYGGKPLTLSANREWVLQDTVNPILFWNHEESEIVRNSLELRDGKRMILLSGPNTGGKTVLLKSLGLSALFARTGFFYPGTGKLLVPFFDAFFVDLGDPQSIEEHISSFSGHVLKMKRILDSFGPRSLILIDEMNSATDPEEGAALSLAFIETVLGQEGAVLVATTHDPRLKVLGLEDRRIESASIVFDEETLKPTYRVVFGVPGRSRALETAERLGLPASVLELARSYLSEEHRGVESVLGKLQSRLGVAEQMEREAQRVKEEAEKLKLEWEEKVRVTVQESLEKARQKLKHVLELAQIEVRETLKKIQSSKSHKQLDEIRRELNEAFEQGERRIESSVVEAAPELSEVLKVEVEEQKIESPKFELGVWVRVPKWKNVGEIVEWDGKRAKVALGANPASTGLGKAFVVTVYPVEMEPLSAQELRTVLGVRGGVGGKMPSRVRVEAADTGPVAEQIDVRGQRLDDAIREVSSYLDRAFRSGKSEVTVVHGLGTGALREGVRALLKKTNYVVNFDDAGSSGATRVRFSV
jgi:DNA mismatch repair protein MutS2